MFALLILYTACYIMQYSIPFLTRSAVGAGALLIELQRMTLNDRIILLEHSSSSAAANDNVEGATNSVGMIVDGQNLRSLVRDAILSSSPTTSSNTGAAAATDDDEDDEDNNLLDAKQDQNATPIEMMEEDAAEQARKYFGVL
jgi:hypothetical protein